MIRDFGDSEIDEDAALKFDEFSVRQNAGQMSREDLLWGVNATRDEIGLVGSAAGTARQFSPFFYHSNTEKGR